MANYDVAVTLAGQFRRNAMSRKDQLVIEAVGKLMNILGSGNKPSAATWNSTINTAFNVAPPTPQAELGALRAAIWWQLAVNGVGTGIAVANQTESAIIGAGSYIMGLSERELEALCIYLEGRAQSVFT